jgi:hypothetical protein
MKSVWRRIRRPLFGVNQRSLFQRPRVLFRLQRDQLGFVCGLCAAYKLLAGCCPQKFRSAPVVSGKSICMQGIADRAVYCR